MEYIFELEMQVRDYECDMEGIVNNAIYQHYLEHTRHEFITKLSKGYDTMIGEGGCTLSGGEKQRLSIARAILKDAPIVLLDEVTASLDPENEVEVQRAINTLIAGRTVIVIAHRLKTIRNADTIVVLDEGRIVEKGRHEDLLNNHGLSAHLWDIQTQIAGWKL